MSSDLLRRAATKLRETANAATPGPWGVGNGEVVARGAESTGRGSFTCIQSVARVEDASDRDLWRDNDPDAFVEIDPEDDAEYIALIHPPVALALADLLEAVDDHTAKSEHYVAAYAVARAVLREDGEPDA